MALEQAKRAGVWTVEDRSKQHFSFSHLYVGLNYSGIQHFIGFDPAKRATRTPIPRSKLAQFGELCEWLFGRQSADKPPLIRSQNPDVKILDEVLRSQDGVAALRQELPLAVARDISKGDERLFREAIVGAKQRLQEARARILTGYSGEKDLLDTTEDILELADTLRDEMSDMRTKRRRRSTRQRRS